MAKGLISISVLNSEKEQIATVQVRASDSLEDLRQAIAKSLGVDPRVSLQLLHGDNYLFGPASLAQLGLSDKAVVSVVKKRGLVVTASADHTGMVWDCKSGKTTFILKGHADVVHSAAFSPDNRLVATGSHDKTAKLWGMDNAACLATLDGHQNIIVSVAFSPEGRLLVTGSWDKSAKVWRLPDTLVVRSSSDEEPKKQPECVMTLEGHEDSLSSACFSPNGKLVATASLDGTARVWNVAGAGECWATMTGHEEGLRSVAFSPDSQLVVTGSMDSTAKVWNAVSGACKLTLEGHKGPVNSVVVSTDGSLIVTGSRDHTAKVWCAKTGNCLQTLKGHRDSLYSVSLTYSGRYVVTGSADGSAKVWTLGTDNAECTLSLEGHREAVRSSTFSHGI